MKSDQVAGGRGLVDPDDVDALLDVGHTARVLDDPSTTKIENVGLRGNEDPMVSAGRSVAVGVRRRRAIVRTDQ